MVFRKNVDIVIEMLSSTGYIIVIIRYLDLLEGFVLLSKPLQKLVRSKLLLPPLFRNSLRLRHLLAIFGVLLSNTETNRTTEHLLKKLTFFSFRTCYQLITSTVSSAKWFFLQLVIKIGRWPWDYWNEYLSRFWPE